MSKQNLALEIKDISKKFGDFTANDHISFNVKQGEIHALLGENGAGKSTLMNILTGLLSPTSGEIFINQEKVDISSPAVAYEKGIGMVHQHFMLIDDFTVTENIMLGAEITQHGFLKKENSEKIVSELSEKYDLKVDPKAKIKDISVGMQQRVEILKLLYRDVDILILDEPTGVLTPQEINELIKTLRHLAAKGKAIILISHKLSEIKAAADRCTIIRRGKKIATVDVDEVSEQELADMMVGRKVQIHVNKEASQLGNEVLKVKDLVLEKRHQPILRGINLNLFAGEILGIAGIDGNGQSELIDVLTGLSQATLGHIYLDGEEITHDDTRQIAEKGMGHIPEDRHKRGLILAMPISDNFILRNYYQKPFSNNLLMRSDVIENNAKDLVNKYHIAIPNISAKASQLSGGNQQKIVIARELENHPKVLIAAQPTRGLDIGAVEEVHERLLEERRKGKAILLVSQELDELMSLSDRIAVIHQGQITGIVDSQETNETELGLLMAGESINKLEKVGENGE
ncbi:ABC transporter ATP-binding protein [Aerococcus tenax]|uniref:ABC transporter ATP-binding protein n=1 Tax=Aerococcus tenax TaxID=3078812 RepID=UPI0018A75E37|nr:ABC transporter ATP-binding protein [Aerococcus tenax]